MSIVPFSKRLLWSQIKEMYSNEWVELSDVDWPISSPTPKRAVVCAHNPDRLALIEQIKKSIKKRSKESDSNVILFISVASDSVIEFDLTGIAA